MKRKIRSASVLFFATAIILCDVAGGAGLGSAGIFSWQDTDGEHLDLLFDGKKVTRYMYAYDTSTEQRTFETYKPFHHVYDAEGNLLTNGPDGSSAYPRKGIRYPHHRGILIGWNKLMFEGRRYDLWHMKEVHQVHQKFPELSAGPDMAQSTALIHWNALDGKPMLVEHRRTIVYRQSDLNVIVLDFQTELRAVRGDVLLDGDPEHAGMQYRAHNGVAAGGKDDKATYLFHADGIDPKKDYDLPWVAMSYGLDSGRYVVQHMNASLQRTWIIGFSVPRRPIHGMVLRWITNIPRYCQRMGTASSRCLPLVVSARPMRRRRTVALG
jgi:hypothetical protein